MLKGDRGLNQCFLDSYQPITLSLAQMDVSPANFTGEIRVLNAQPRRIGVPDSIGSSYTSVRLVDATDSLPGAMLALA